MLEGTSMETGRNVAETRWQAARRRRRRTVDRLLSVLFGVLAVASLAYIFGLARVVAPHLID